MIPRDWQAEGADRAVGITPATGARKASPEGEAERSATIAGSVVSNPKTAGVLRNACCSFVISGDNKMITLWRQGAIPAAFYVIKPD